MNANMYDVIAKMSFEGKQNIWLSSHPRIDYSFQKSKKYLRNGMTVCEIGVGDGYLLQLLINSEFSLDIVGIDVSSYLIQKLSETFRSYSRVKLFVHDVTVPLNDYESSFDIVFALNLLEHIKNIGKAIENIAMILKPKGLLVASLPWKEDLADNMVVCPRCLHVFHRYGHYHTFQSYDDIKRVLGENFKIIEFSFVQPTGIKRRIKGFLKRTIFKKKYYSKEGLPRFQTTCFFISECVKPQA